MNPLASLGAEPLLARQAPIDVPALTARRAIDALLSSLRRRENSTSAG